MNKSLLRGTRGLIDSKDVGVHLVLLDYATYESSQIDDVDGGNQVFTLAYNLESRRVLDPSFEEVVVKDTFSVTIAQASAKDMHSQFGLSVSA